MCRIFPAVMAFILIVFSGCSSGSGINPATPDELPEQNFGGTGGLTSENYTNRGLLGLWEISINADRTSVEAIPRHSGASHFNLVYFMENAPCNDCLTLQNVAIISPNEITVDMRITHPFPGIPELTCFDPRGIVITKADTFFPAFWQYLTMGPDSLVLLNPDGYTDLFNPVDYPQDAPVSPLLKYTPGKYQINGLLDATLNPFVAYQKASPRRMLTSGSSSVQTLDVHLPDGPLAFGYAIDAAWSPTGGDVTDPEVDFPPEANCLEPYRIDVDVDGALDTLPGSFVIVNVAVYDHQGIDTVSSVQLYAPYVFDGLIDMVQTGGQGANIGFFTASVTNENASSEGEFGLMVRVIGDEPDPIHGNILAYQLARLEIGETSGSPGWVVSWGGQDPTGWTIVKHIARDLNGNIFCSGTVYGNMDFDPGPGVDAHNGGGDGDVFLIKFDPDGLYRWGVSFGHSGPDTAEEVVVDSYGSVYLAGFFYGSVDFDPGPGVDEHSTVDTGFVTDLYLSKFNSNGVYQWAVTSGAIGVEICEGACWSPSEPGGIYMVGLNENNDAFLRRYDTEGGLNWVRSWGNSEDERAMGVAADNSGYVYVTGGYYFTVDFDPGPGEEIHTSYGDSQDIYLSKYNKDGNFIWCRTFGGYSDDHITDITCDSYGNTCIIGDFYSVADFDPGPDIDSKDPADGKLFITRFDSEGNHLFVQNYGSSPSHALQKSVAVSDAGDVVITGEFYGSIDFDPGPGVDMKTCDDHEDMFALKLGPSGEYIWGRTWTGHDTWEHCNDSVFDDIGSSILCGYFIGTIDFDPGLAEYLLSAPQSHAGYIMKLRPDGYW
ncbi:MAG: hypothetical protein NTY09_06645 [bacterium]|nr:hypothetical protein [bacterium]